jgi:Fe-S-cluster containining protein
MEPSAFLAQHTRRVFGRLSLREETDGRCVLFDSRLGCRAYAVRPRQCRTWPFWPRIVANPAAWDREAADCPGMNSGELIAPDEIDRRSQPAELPK